MTATHRYSVPAGDLVLHHYWMSPYAEKVRCILGFKRLPWKSVLIPIVMPKPDLLALTGGYRKTPVLQIGADVFCDTDLIARVLDASSPIRRCFPTAQRDSVTPLARGSSSSSRWPSSCSV